MPIVSRAGQSSGIGLAVPGSMARRVVDELIRHGRVIRADSGIFSVFELDQGWFWKNRCGTEVCLYRQVGEKVPA
jgi:hypothetical protein